MSAPVGTLADVSPKPTKTNPLGAGRNPRAGEAAVPFTLKLAPSERASYQKAAELAGQSVADWIRAACAARLPKTTKRKER